MSRILSLRLIHAMHALTSNIKSVNLSGLAIRWATESGRLVQTSVILRSTEIRIASSSDQITDTAFSIPHRNRGEFLRLVRKTISYQY